MHDPSTCEREHVNSLRNIMGCIRRRGYDVRLENSPRDISTHHRWNLRGLHSSLYASLPWWFRGLWTTRGTPCAITIMPQEMSACMTQPQSGQMHVRCHERSPSRTHSEQRRYCGRSRKNQSHRGGSSPM